MIANQNIRILIFAILLSCIACNDQISPEKSSQAQSNTTTAQSDTPKQASDPIKSISSLNHPTDSIRINQYKDNQKDGFWRTKFNNGQIKSEGNYTLGLKEGLHKKWEDSGVLVLEGFYKNGKANGLMKWFHEQGHLAGSGNMRDGIRIGPWKICDVENTGFCIDANFKNGKRSGIWKIKHSATSDKIWKEQTWKNDKLVSEKCRDENGEIIKCERQNN